MQVLRVVPGRGQPQRRPAGVELRGEAAGRGAKAAVAVLGGEQIPGRSAGGARGRGGAKAGGGHETDHDQASA